MSLPSPGRIRSKCRSTRDGSHYAPCDTDCWSRERCAGSLEVRCRMEVVVTPGSLLILPWYVMFLYVLLLLLLRCRYVARLAPVGISISMPIATASTELVAMMRTAWLFSPGRIGKGCPLQSIGRLLFIIVGGAYVCVCVWCVECERLSKHSSRLFCTMHCCTSQSESG